MIAASTDGLATAVRKLVPCSKETEFAFYFQKVLTFKCFVHTKLNDVNFHVFLAIWKQNLFLINLDSILSKKVFMKIKYRFKMYLFSCFNAFWVFCLYLFSYGFLHSFCRRKEEPPKTVMSRKEPFSLNCFVQMHNYSFKIYWKHLLTWKKSCIQVYLLIKWSTCDTLRALQNIQMSRLFYTHLDECSFRFTFNATRLPFKQCLCKQFWSSYEYNELIYLCRWVVSIVSNVLLLSNANSIAKIE